MKNIKYLYALLTVCSFSSSFGAEWRSEYDPVEQKEERQQEANDLEIKRTDGYALTNATSRARKYIHKADSVISQMQTNLNAEPEVWNIIAYTGFSLNMHNLYNKAIGYYKEACRILLGVMNKSDAAKFSKMMRNKIHSVYHPTWSFADDIQYLDKIFTFITESAPKNISDTLKSMSASA